MALTKFQLRPGINTMATQLRNEGGWSLSNMVRWRSDGQQRYIEKFGGWSQMFMASVAGTVRALFAYEDLSDNKNLMIGGDGGLQAYIVPAGMANSAGNLVTMNLARRIDSTLYAAPTVATFTGTSGSNVIQVTDTGHGAVNGDQVSIPVQISIGGIIVSPRTVTVTFIDANNWSFVGPANLTSNANTSGNYGTVPVFEVTSAEQNTIVLPGNSGLVRVVFPNHGLIAGNNFVVPSAVVWQNFTPTQSVPAGTYQVYNVIDANTFQILIPGIVQTAQGFGAISGFDPAQSAGVIHGVENLIYLRTGSLASATGHWYLDNFGGEVIIGLGNGPIFVFVPPVTTGSPAVAQQITGAPLVNTGCLVAMPQAQVIAWGSETTIGSGVQDPLMIRWCDAGNLNTWQGLATNQAGNFRLSKGSQIIGAIQAPQAILVWTDVDLWSMIYIGAGLVYSINPIGHECGLLAPKAAAVFGRSTYWPTQKGFWEFSDNGVRQVDCPVWDTVFTNMHPSALNNPNSKVFAGVNSAFGEVIWFFPSTAGTGECDSFVKWRPNDGPNGWDYAIAIGGGGLARSAWLGVSVFGQPLGADFTPSIQQHETGYDANGVAMPNVYAESGFFDISDGDSIPNIRGIIPDVKWQGNGGSLAVTLWGQNYSNDVPIMKGPYTVTPTTKRIPARMRKRQIALRIDWAATPGFSARIGAFRARIAPAGRRP